MSIPIEDVHGRDANAFLAALPATNQSIMVAGGIPADRAATRIQAERSGMVVALRQEQHPSDGPTNKPNVTNDVASGPGIGDNSGDMPKNSHLEEQTELLARRGVAEAHCSDLAEGFCQLTDIAIDHPEAALSAVRQACDKARVDANWQECVAPHATGETIVPGQEPEGEAPKKRGRPPRTPPTEAEVTNGKSLLWRANIKGEAIDPEELKKAARDVAWVRNEERRRKAQKAKGSGLP